MQEVFDQMCQAQSGMTPEKSKNETRKLSAKMWLALEVVAVPVTEGLQMTPVCK